VFGQSLSLFFFWQVRLFGFNKWRTKTKHIPSGALIVVVVVLAMLRSLLWGKEAANFLGEMGG